VTKLPDLAKLKEHFEALRLAIVNVETFYKLYVDDDFPDLEIMIQIYTNKFTDITDQANQHIEEQKYQELEKVEKQIIEIRLGLEGEKVYANYLMLKEKESINMQMKGIQKTPEKRESVPYDQYLIDLDRARKEVLDVYHGKQWNNLVIEQRMHSNSKEHKAQISKLEEEAGLLKQEIKLLKEQIGKPLSDNILPFLSKSKDSTKANSNVRNSEPNASPNPDSFEHEIDLFNGNPDFRENSNEIMLESKPYAVFSYPELIDLYNETTGEFLKKKNKIKVLRVNCRIPSHLKFLESLNKIQINGLKTFELYNVPQDSMEVKNFIMDISFLKLEKFVFNSNSDDPISMRAYIPYFEENPFKNQIKSIYFANWHIPTQDIVGVLAAAKSIESTVGLVDSYLEAEAEFSFEDALDNATFKAIDLTKSGKSNKSDFKNYPIILVNILNALGQVKKMRENLEQIYLSGCGISDRQGLDEFVRNANLNEKMKIIL
jgi:hypothetical protein